MSDQEYTPTVEEVRGSYACWVGDPEWFDRMLAAERRAAAVKALRDAATEMSRSGRHDAAAILADRVIRIESGGHPDGRAEHDRMIANERRAAKVEEARHLEQVAREFAENARSYRDNETDFPDSRVGWQANGVYQGAGDLALRIGERAEELESEGK
jgi:hypothetical protein